MSNPIQNIRKKVEKLSATLTYRDVACGYLQATFGPLRHAAEKLARMADATPRAAINWMRGEAAPNGDTLITLMARDAEFRARILDLVEKRRCADGHFSSSSDPAVSDVDAA